MISASSTCDLLIRAARIVCSEARHDGPGEVAIRGGRIDAVGPNLGVTAGKTLEFVDAVLLPGLIDLHAHPAKSRSQWGVDPDQHLLARGTTTVLSQGDAGADNFAAYLHNTIETSQTDIRLAINLWHRGDIGPGGCFEHLDWLEVDKCAAAIERHRKHIWGISVNVSHHCCGPTDPKDVLRRGLAVAIKTGLPLLFGLRRPADWPLAERFALLRPGDVVTYCFRSSPHCIVKNGKVLECVRAARERGVLFDIGHGTNSFDPDVTRAAIADGFLPDTISTDLQRAHVGATPVHDLPLVMSKLGAAGMSEADIFRAVTFRPAQILRDEREIGTLRVGSRHDLTVLRWDAGWQTIAIIRNGRFVGVPASAGLI